MTPGCAVRGTGYSCPGHSYTAPGLSSLPPHTHAQALSSDTSRCIKSQWSPAWKGRLQPPARSPGTEAPLQGLGVEGSHPLRALRGHRGTQGWSGGPVCDHTASGTLDLAWAGSTHTGRPMTTQGPREATTNDRGLGLLKHPPVVRSQEFQTEGSRGHAPSRGSRGGPGVSGLEAASLPCPW